MGGDEVPTETREEVATAMRTALAKHGYARLTTKQIAAEAEMSEAGLYYHYDTKDELIATFLEAAADHLSEELADVEASDPETALRAALDHLFTHHDDEEALGSTSR